MPLDPDTPRADRDLTICVAAATRRRPVMLQRLLESFAQLAVPDRAKLLFLIVENDDASHSTEVMDNFRDALPGELLYALETTPGIPMARNRGLAEAAARNADMLLYVDDDETVARDWLVKIVTAWREGSAELIGGPVRLQKPEAQLTRTQETVFDGMVKRFAKKEAAAADRARTGKGERVTIVTNNWLCDMRVYTELGIRFDEKLQFTGGSDTKFCRDARAKGVETGWAPDAIVYETVPPERLTLPYQFSRGRDQSATSFRAKMAAGKWGNVAVSILLAVPLKIIGIFLLALSLPVTRSFGLVSIFRQAGWIVGRLSALFGRRSNLYSETTGY